MARDDFNFIFSQENDCLKLEHQLLDLQRLHESVLVEKSEIINKLTANLEESQSQCQKLISNSTNHDIAKLMNQLRSQKAEINSLSIQVSALKVTNSYLCSYRGNITTYIIRFLEREKSAHRSNSEIEI